MGWTPSPHPDLLTQEEEWVGRIRRLDLIGTEMTNGKWQMAKKRRYENLVQNERFFPFVLRGRGEKI